MGAPGGAGVQPASQPLLSCWAGSGTEAGQQPGVLREGEEEVKTPLMFSTLINVTIITRT